MRVHLEILGGDELDPNMRAVQKCIKLLEEIGQRDNIASMMTALTIVNLALIIGTSDDRDMALGGADMLRDTLRESINHGAFVRGEVH